MEQCQESTTYSDCRVQSSRYGQCKAVSIHELIASEPNSIRVMAIRDMWKISTAHSPARKHVCLLPTVDPQNTGKLWRVTWLIGSDRSYPWLADVATHKPEIMQAIFKSPKLWNILSAARSYWMIKSLLHITEWPNWRFVWWPNWTCSCAKLNWDWNYEWLMLNRLNTDKSNIRVRWLCTGKHPTGENSIQQNQRANGLIKETVM